MFKPVYDSRTEKGRMMILIDKRNKQFSALFRKIRDPYSILQFYRAMRGVYDKYFASFREPEEFLGVLMWVYNKEFRFFYKDDLKEILLGYDTRQIRNLLRRIVASGLLNYDTTTQLFTLTAEAHLLLQNFSRECLSAVMAIRQDKRKGNRHKKLQR